MGFIKAAKDMNSSAASGHKSCPAQILDKAMDDLFHGSNIPDMPSQIGVTYVDEVGFDVATTGT